ncbi:MAG: hypothetical protein AVDCRST_MAG43-1794 [uncultured Thermomicrobiales bacterium]|uniref:Transposase IS200-like domain-containing protein n=1 Tax=uncultured Thermomicrobiales bacterium TaxID=1645740 RepID=A0A6J4UVR0_9BACT|nr:MAG: hypothetical protein AVDCRST_MAG43-1794 [uncultured Thermomicrobiales bacterium]
MDHQKRYRSSSLRLRDYDYAQAGTYFVTLCVHDRACLFGDVLDDTMHPSASGDMLLHWWTELSNKYPEVEVDAVIVMPNHLHGVILITDCGDAAETPRSGASLGAIVGWFKTMTTNAYIRGVRASGWKPFSRRLWQSNYYEHIIQNELAHD